MAVIPGNTSTNNVAGFLCNEDEIINREFEIDNARWLIMRRIVRKDSLPKLYQRISIFWLVLADVHFFCQWYCILGVFT